MYPHTYEYLAHVTEELVSNDDPTQRYVNEEKIGEGYKIIIACLALKIYHFFSLVVLPVKYSWPSTDVQTERLPSRR